MKLRIHDQELDIRQGQGTLVLDGAPVNVQVLRQRRLGETLELSVLVGQQPVQWWVTAMPDGTWMVQGAGGTRAGAALASATAATTGPHGPIKTPMAGVVTSVHVTAGQEVATGAPLAVVEAMKMRYTLTAEADGRVESVLVEERALVTANQVLLHLSPP